MNKYQYNISFNDKNNTASSKAIQDCRSILANLGYRDYGIESTLTPNKSYLVKLIVNTMKLFIKIQPKSIVAVQYPLLSGNEQFKYFIKLLRLKKVKFFCIVHDLDDLRYIQKNTASKKDINVLNNYDSVIVHNDVMRDWLLKNGIKAEIVVLGIFDYLAIKGRKVIIPIVGNSTLKTIVFAGNLSKSGFIYSLEKIQGWKFNLYGPDFFPEKVKAMQNAKWMGTLGPEEIVTKMDGSFGLIWDGEYIERLDNTYGNYIKYNNPHKLSLYIAAGLPVIAPINSAIAGFVEQHNIGILINNLTELSYINIHQFRYDTLRKNVLQLSEGVKSGHHLNSAVKEVENKLLYN